MATLVTAYRKRDGAKVQIPSDWLDHPRLGTPYQRSKPTAAQQDKATPEKAGSGQKDR